MSTYDPTDLRGQEREKAEVEANKRFARKSEDDDFKKLMRTDWGRRIVWRILEQAMVFGSTFSTNSMQMAFSEGKRAYGLKVLEQINNVCPELYQTMTKENTNVRNDDGNADHSN